MLSGILSIIFTLPNWLLLKLSGAPQIVHDERQLHPPMQFFISLMNKREAPKEINLENFRKIYDWSGQIYKKMPKSVSWIDHEIDVGEAQIKCRQYSKDKSSAKSALLYIHGGGFTIGSIESHHHLTAYLCEQLDMQIFSLDYRLAPEHPFPTAIDDCEKAFEWLQANSERFNLDPNQISIGGDSAGGNLSTVVSLRRKRANNSLPKSQMLIYPGVGADFDNGSMQRCAENFILTKKVMEWFHDCYRPGQDDTENIPTEIAPILADDLDGLPPALVITAGFDPLCDEGEAYAKKLSTHGVKTKFLEFSEMPHSFVTMAFIPGVKERLNEIAAAFKTLN